MVEGENPESEYGATFVNTWVGPILVAPAKGPIFTAVLLLDPIYVP